MATVNDNSESLVRGQCRSLAKSQGGTTPGKDVVPPDRHQANHGMHTYTQKSYTAGDSAGKTKNGMQPRDFSFEQDDAESGY